MKQLAVFLFVVCLTGMQTVALSQFSKGFYTGQLRLNNSARFNLQLEIDTAGGQTDGMMRLRFIENQQVTGCDNWVSGKMLKDGSMVFTRQVTLRETNVPRGVCDDFHELRLSAKTSAATGAMEWTGSMYDPYREIMGRVTLALEDTALSFALEEDRAEAAYRLWEKKIGMATSDSARITGMLQGRKTILEDSVQIAAINATLRVEGPEADMFHRLTVMIDNNVLLLNNAIRQRGANIRLNDLAPGTYVVTLLCYHTMVDVAYPVQLTLTAGEWEKKWVVPVATYRNTQLKITIAPPPLP